MLILLLGSSCAHRETTLDQIVTIHQEIIYNIPAVPRWCDRLGLTGEFISVGDANLYVETEGEGIPLVVLHGGPGATHHYFHPYFSRAAEFATVIYYDQRGCGLSDYNPGKGYSVYQAVDDLENLRMALGVDEWIVVGHSYGGLLTQMYALEYPDNLAGLIRVCSSPGLGTQLEPSRQFDMFSEEEAVRIQEIWRMLDLSLELELYNRQINGDWKRQSYYRPSLEEIAEFALYECVHDPIFTTTVLRGADRSDLSEAFLDFQIPTLIIEGRWDLTWNTDKPGVLHSQHPNAEMVVLEHSGHSPFDDEPAAFFDELRRITDFINSAR